MQGVLAFEVLASHTRHKDCKTRLC